MPQAKVLSRSAMFAAATALTAVGFLNVPAPAQAAPACEKWGWPGGNFSIKAGNQTTTNMSTSQDRVVGRPFYISDGAPSSDATYGNPSGGYTGSDIDITINWDQGPGAGYASHFVGKINDEGLASGTLHLGNRDDAWHSDNKFSCTVYKPAEQAPPPPPPAELPKQGPTVSWDPTIGGLVAHITDRSGVTSQCTYTSDFYTRSFALKANSTFDLKIVPAIPQLRNWDVTISCDNGTSTQTTTFF
jgi:hypothetical protein